ncbi:thiamine pyrophosphate-binding protein [Yoonia sp. MH D7]
MSSRPLGAQISHMLKERGIEVIFGIPGVHNQEMYRGIEEAGLQHVLARHEQGAGFMADGYARATGRAGVCYVITGPGLCNIMTPMGQAYSDSVPMLVLSSCLDETAAKRGQLHQMKDQQGAAATVCDWSETATTDAAAFHLIDRALYEFESKRKRPKSITLPIALLESISSSPLPPAPPAVALPDPLASQIVDLAEMIREARRPLFIFGGGAAHIDFAGDVMGEWGAASLTTYAGRGLVSDGDPLHFGACLARASSADIIATADLVVVFGSELSEVDLWRDQLGHQSDMVRIDIDPSVLCDRHNADHTILADSFAVLDQLSEILEGKLDTDWTPEEVASARKKWRSEVEAERPGILAVADTLRAALPADTMIFSDMTQFAYAAKEAWPMDRPAHWHHPYGFGTLGYALPAAIGGKIGMGDAPVIAIAGDYGFQYSLQELMVAVELELTLPIIIWDNGKLGEIEDGMIRAQIAPNAVVQKNPDFVKLADAYGAAALAPKSLAELHTAIHKALTTKGPTLIHVTADIC